jgi:hypothetical protein
MSDPATVGVDAVSSWSTEWREALPTRSADDQASLVERARRAVAELQAAAHRVEGEAGRALHRRPLHVTATGRLDISRDVPPAVALGPFAPGASWPVLVRLSSAYPLARPDLTPDQRGIAVRIAGGERRIDLLATTGEAHHARDGAAMIASLSAARHAVRGGVGGKVGALAALIGELGLRDALRMARTVSRAADHGVSLASLTFFSRAPFALGPFAVRYRFAARHAAEAGLRAGGGAALTDDLAERLRSGDVAWDFQLQGFTDRERTPLDDHRVAWASPWVPLGSLVLTGQGVVAETPIGFRPAPSWPDPSGPVLEPVGDLNALRAAAYEVSALGRDAADRGGA